MSSSTFVKRLLATALPLLLASSCSRDKETVYVSVDRCEASDACRAVNEEHAQIVKSEAKALYDHNLQEALRLRIRRHYLESQESIYREGGATLDTELRIAEDQYHRLRMLSGFEEPPKGPYTCTEPAAECVRLADDIKDLESQTAGLPAGLVRQPDELLTVFSLNLRKATVHLRRGGKAKDSVEQLRLDSDHELLRRLLAEISARGTVPDLMTLDGACPKDVTQECTKLQKQLIQLQADRRKTLAAKDEVQVRRLTVEINYTGDLLALLRHGEPQPEARAALEQAYRALRGDSTAPQITPIAAIPYTGAETAAVSAVASEFGELFLAPTTVDASTGAVGYEELPQPAKRPWTIHLFRSTPTALYAFPDSPLQKLDQLLALRGLAPVASSYEASATAGDRRFAHGWAVASLVHPEPTTAKDVDGISFSVEDQRTLLAKRYEGYPTRRYGNPYLGPQSDGQSQDLRPEAFHRLVTGLMAERGQGFYFDLNPGAPVQIAIARSARYQAVSERERPGTLKVTMELQCVKDRRVSADQRITFGPDIFAVVLTYRLTLDPNTRDAEGRSRVLSGEWIGSSLNVHPDVVWIPDPTGEQKNVSPAIADNLEFLKQVGLILQ